MQTSDDQVVDGAVYELVLQTPGQADTILRVNSQTYRLLLDAWRHLELRIGHRLCFSDFFDTLVRNYRGSGSER